MDKEKLSVRGRPDETLTDAATQSRRPLAAETGRNKVTSLKGPKRKQALASDDITRGDVLATIGSVLPKLVLPDCYTWRAAGNRQYSRDRRFKSSTSQTPDFIKCLHRRNQVLGSNTKYLDAESSQW